MFEPGTGFEVFDREFDGGVLGVYKSLCELGIHLESGLAR